MNTAAHATDRLTAPSKPRPLARLRARLAPSALDRRIAAGADPWTNPELTPRAERLLRRATRRQIADSLESAVVDARGGGRPNPLQMTAPIARPSVAEAGDDLVVLVQRLRAAQPVRPQGVALARMLLVDGTGPLYSAGDALPLVARRALAALDDAPVAA